MVDCNCLCRIDHIVNLGIECNSRSRFIGVDMKISKETELSLWKHNNSLFDQDHKIWPKESFLSKIQKNVLAVIS